MKGSQKGDVVAESAVRFMRALPAPPDKTWRFLTDSALLPEWYGEGGIEGREGGAVSLMGGHVRGVVTGWRPEKFLAYSWNVFSPGETLSRWPVSYLEFALDAADGGTRLILTHRPIPAAMQSRTLTGWHTMLDLIDAALRGRFPRRADLFAQNAALYGVDLNTLEKV
jgi:uncharacterized protein YndB with AHSA1/START domain